MLKHSNIIIQIQSIFWKKIFSSSIFSILINLSWPLVYWIRIASIWQGFYWCEFFHRLVHYWFVTKNLVRERLDRIVPLHLFNLYGCVLVQELVDGKVATANTYLYSISFDFYTDAFWPKAIHTLALSQELNFEVLLIFIIIDKIRQFEVNCVIF